ncbi:MAG TPA: hypothetical protein VG738_13750 [Chitinophagaceae bacterium]|nr:hypothetical protein [Chitinophagaceae bacterium]
MGIKYILLWLPMVLLAFANATLRQLVWVKNMGDLKAHQLSTITLIVLCAIYTAFIFRFLSVQNTRQAFLIGGVWVILTVLFEFSLGRLTQKSWAYLLQDYNLATGHIWPVFLLCLFMLPYTLYILRK